MQAAEASARPQVFSFPTDYNDDPYSDSSKYESLTGPVLDQRLRQLAKPQKANDTDTVSIQPCTNPKESSQDRIAQADWDFGSGKWCFRAVFDGHSGHETVNYTSANLPEVIKGNLERHLKDNSASPDVAEVLKRSITEFDNGLTKALTDLFPGESLRTLSDDEVCEIIDKDENLPVVLRCMHGTTALVSLTNPAKTDVWVASLGDCRAVLASRTPNGSWSSKTLSFNHNGTDQTEAKRIQEEHPGETGLTHNDRVLGAIAITRAIGDHVFKLPVIYSQRVFTRSRAALPTFVKKMGDVQPRVLTPPYLSNTPEVSHTKLDTPQSVLFLFSDGLFDLYDMAYGKTIAMPGFWSYLMREVLTGVDAEKEDHLALRFLRHGLGGDNEDRVSCWLTTQSQARWMDDTTILAQRMWC